MASDPLFSNQEELLQLLNSADILTCPLCRDNKIAHFCISCEHGYCYKCIGEWVVKKFSCPFCRLSNPTFEETKNVKSLKNLIPITSAVQEKDLHKALSCKICKKLARDPLQCSDCTRMFCQRCFQHKTFKENKCPKCQVKAPKLQKYNRLLNEVFDQAKVNCEICKQDIIYGEFHAHEVTCRQLSMKRLAARASAQSARMNRKKSTTPRLQESSQSLATNSGQKLVKMAKYQPSSGASPSKRTTNIQEIAENIDEEKSNMQESQSVKSAHNLRQDSLKGSLSGEEENIVNKFELNKKSRSSQSQSQLVSYGQQSDDDDELVFENRGLTCSQYLSASWTGWKKTFRLRTDFEQFSSQSILSFIMVFLTGTAELLFLIQLAFGWDWFQIGGSLTSSYQKVDQQQLQYWLVYLFVFWFVSRIYLNYLHQKDYQTFNSSARIFSFLLIALLTVFPCDMIIYFGYRGGSQFERQLANISWIKRFSDLIRLVLISLYSIEGLMDGGIITTGVCFGSFYILFLFVEICPYDHSDIRNEYTALVD